MKKKKVYILNFYVYEALLATTIYECINLFAYTNPQHLSLTKNNVMDVTSGRVT